MKKYLSLLVIFLAVLSFTSFAQAADLQDKSTFYTTAAFSDVPMNNTEEFKAIQWAYHNHIVSGSNGNFNPNGRLTEAHFVKMYTIYFNLIATNAAVDSKDWTNTYYDAAKKYGVPVNGYTNVQVRRADLQRGTVAQMLAYALGKPTDLNSATSYLMANDISKAQNPNEKTPALQFGVNNSLTRKQAALFLYRMYQKDITQLNTVYNVLPEKEFFLGGTAAAKVVHSAYNSLELQFVSEGQVFGGYITKDGQTFEGYTIGQTLAAGANGRHTVTVNGKELTIFIDTLDQHKITAIYWVETSSFATSKIRAIEQDFSDKKLTSWEKLMNAVMNVSRVKNNLPALQYDNKIAAVAKSHSNYMLKTNDFAHTTQAGQRLQDRFNSLKVPYIAGGENLAANSSTVFEAHNRLMISPAHRPNILDADFEQAGIGIAMNAQFSYYTINFITYE